MSLLIIERENNHKENILNVIFSFCHPYDLWRAGFKSCETHAIN